MTHYTVRISSLMLYVVHVYHWKSCKSTSCIDIVSGCLCGVMCHTSLLLRPRLRCDTLLQLQCVPVVYCNCQSSTRAVRVLDGSQQKADVVKTDYSNSLLMITKM